MVCDPLFIDPFEFPRRPQNRPGLPRIAYRIGRYADFVEAMTRAINLAPELAAWTHRDPDDPGIALLEGAAILGDILTFYQEHYINEAFLRTVAWRESVAELVRLTGYRLAPGIGGRATLAFEARGNAPVVIRQGFPVKADLADVPAPADFQTDAELTAWPHLGRFNLFRQRHYGPVIPGGQAQFELSSADGAIDSIALEAVELKKGDRLLLLPEENLLALILQVVLGWKYVEQPTEEIVIVDKVERSRGRAIVTLAGNLTHGWLSQCRAYLLGRTFKHYGAAAPLQFVQTVMSAAVPPVPETTVTDTEFQRNLDKLTDVDKLTDLDKLTDNGDGYSLIDPHTFPLDQEVTDLAAGRTVIVTGTGTFVSYPDPLPFAITREATAVRHAGPRWGNLSAPASFVRLGDVLAPAWANGFGATADLRTLHLHETRGPELKLRPLSDPASTAFASGTNALHFYGTATQAQAFAGRLLYLSHADGRSVELVCTNAATDFAVPAPDAPQMWPLSFDRAPAPFTRADFDETTPTVTVFGNLVDASQGKSEREAVLGNGDHRQSFQTFPLPKSPLTYFLSAGAIPPQIPELEIWVNGRLWIRVDAFFGHGPKEEIYIVREDAEGRSFVQFGDGETGARLPSGVKNVSAVYRTGTGARGPIKAGATPTASERPPGFDKVTLAGIVSGGADPEDQERAREAAPGKVQSLGRLVSIRDYETETLAIPGVVTATAACDLYAGVPAVVLRVLLEAGREAEFSEVRASIAHAQRCRGPDRFALVVEQALLRYAFADVTYARDPTYQQADVEAALRAALGLFGDAANERTGLFGLHARRLGEREYASRIEGRLQNVTGVVWCKVTGLGLFTAPAPGAPPVTDPATLVLPPAPRTLLGTLECSAHELLQLADLHLTLTAISEPTGECV
jgi:hypothetical protein